MKPTVNAFGKFSSGKRLYAGFFLYATAAVLFATTARAAGPRTVTVAQSGTADVVGADSTALQKAAQMLKPGDTLIIGPGTYTMQNSLFVPSGVTVRGTKDKTILRKSRGVESVLAEDGD